MFTVVLLSAEAKTYISFLFLCRFPARTLQVSFSGLQKLCILYENMQFDRENSYVDLK